MIRNLKKPADICKHFSQNHLDNNSYSTLEFSFYSAKVYPPFSFIPTKNTEYKHDLNDALLCASPLQRVSFILREVWVVH